MEFYKLLIDITLVSYCLGVIIYTGLRWQSVNNDYSSLAWILSFICILISGRILLCYAHTLRLTVVTMLRLIYFLLINIWSILGLIFYIRANSILENTYKSVMIISIIFCFIISFILRRASLQIPYRNSENNQQGLLANRELTVQLNLEVVKMWMTIYMQTEQEFCAVCCEEFVNGKELVKLPECNHFFHYDCITDWLNVKPLCPICKNDVSMYLQAK
ncbi:hypothetical protein SteCoe_37844 [Stentor coeruleus]|uniref:RING-type domain-containing protein n=1 Tax=Stentor coeruleus TaxID=5963 RepID=A0A1R2AML5_9CILI|nr:hypothetical protein SteCoe_37844 [Stentor coeruleus]